MDHYQINPDFFKYFKIEEFVPKSIFKSFSNNSILFLDPRVLNLATAYRIYFDKPVLINNWHKGGTFENRGYRTPNSKVGAAFSQHKFGRAFDCNILGLDEKDVYNEIVKNFEHFKTFGLSTVENIQFTPTWIHSDVRLTSDPNKLLIVNP